MNQSTLVASDDAVKITQAIASRPLLAAPLLPGTAIQFSEGYAMTDLMVLAVIGVFAAGTFAGIIGLVGIAIHREEKNHTLTSEAAGNLIRVGRWLNGVYTRAPIRTATDRETTSVLARPPARRPLVLQWAR